MDGKRKEKKKEKKKKEKLINSGVWSRVYDYLGSKVNKK